MTEQNARQRLVTMIRQFIEAEPHDIDALVDRAIELLEELGEEGDLGNPVANTVKES